MFLSRNRIKDVVDASSEVKKDSKNVVFLCHNIFQINWKMVVLIMPNIIFENSNAYFEIQKYQLYFEDVMKILWKISKSFLVEDMY